MKNLYAFLFFIPQALLAINIHNVQVTQPNAQNINISLTTEAEELYYFDSWNYSVTANVITINAYFIEGFGSTILYLNNNFSVPLSVPQQYIVVMRIFYTDPMHTFKIMKDMVRAAFRFQKHRPTIKAVAKTAKRFKFLT